MVFVYREQAFSNVRPIYGRCARMRGGRQRNMSHTWDQSCGISYQAKSEPFIHLFCLLAITVQF